MGMDRSIIIDLNPDKHNQGLCYYRFMINLERLVNFVNFSAIAILFF